MPRPPPELMEEIIEEILLRLPPSDPASLVRAALVSTPWCRIVCGAAFRRRFRAFHRTPPMLGFLCDPRVKMEGDRWDDVLVPTSSAFRPRAEPFAWWRPWDARHGRVLFHDTSSGSYRPHVWNPITDAWITLPEMPNEDPDTDCWTSAVLCAAADTGECDHLDCHDGPFTVVIVGSDELYEEPMFSYVYSSESGRWSEPTHIDGPYDSIGWDMSMLIGNALYFKFDKNELILEYDLGTREMSLMDLPRYEGTKSIGCVQLMRTEGGCRLGFARLEETRLCLWSRDDEADVGWAPDRVIELEKLIPFDASLNWDTSLIGFTEGVSAIFMHVGDEVFNVDLKSGKVMKVYEGPICNVVPFMSFRTPALRPA